MEPARDGVLLRVFIGDADRSGGHSLYRAIIDEAFKGGIAGTTVLHGPMGFGKSRYVNNEFVVDSPGNLPIVIEIIDTPEKIEAFLPQIDGMISSGLVTLEKVRMLAENDRPFWQSFDRDAVVLEGAEYRPAP